MCEELNAKSQLDCGQLHALPSVQMQFIFPSPTKRKVTKPEANETIDFHKVGLRFIT